MTREETLVKLKNDSGFAINFLLENNFPAVKAQLLSMGYAVANEKEAYKVIKGFFDSGRKDLVMQVFSIPYNNDAPNYTGGLRLPSAPNAKIDFSFIPFLGDFLNSAIYAGTVDPATILANQQQQAAAAEAARAKTTTTIIIALVVLVIAGIAAYAYVNKNKKST